MLDTARHDAASGDAFATRSRKMFGRVVVLLFAFGLGTGEARELRLQLDEPTGRPFSLPSRAEADGVIPVTRFSLSSGEEEVPARGATADGDERDWLPWVLVGALVLAVVVTASTRGDSAGADEPPPPDATPPPGVGTPTPDPGGDPGGAGNGTGIGDPAVRTAPRPRADGRPVRQGLFLSVGTTRDGKRATGRTAGFDEDRDFLSLGYDRLLASAGSAGLALTLARADTVFEASDDERRQGSGTALLFAERPLSAATRLSAYAGASVSDDETVRFSDGSELQPLDGAGGGGGGSFEGRLQGDTTVRTALIGAALGHELPTNVVRAELRLNVDYARSVSDGYDETGDPFLALSFGSRVRESLGVRTGVELARAVGTAHGVFLPQLGVDWIHESRDDARSVVGTLREDPSFVSITRGDEPDRSHGSANLGLTFLARNGLQTFVAYEGLFAHAYRTSSTVSVGARLEF